jgi:hypothetical protein
MKLRGNTVISQKIGVELDVADPTGSRRRTVRDLAGKLGTIAIIRDIQRTLKI